MNKPRVCLLELGGSHFECIETQIHFLKEDFHISLLVNTDSSTKINKLTPLVDKVEVMDFPSKKSFGFFNSLKISRFLKKAGYDYVVLNTAQGGIKWVCLTSLFSKAKFFGILHNVHKLKSGFGQKIISLKVAHYFVLSTFLEKYTRTFLKKSVSSFFPIFIEHQNVCSVQKPTDEFWICIPGNIEFKRRDYLQLIETLHTTHISEKIKFILLGATKGKDAEILKGKIKESALERFFILFDNYVETSVFNTYVSLSDCVMPLTSANSSDASLYLNYKVSGSWITAFAFHKPIFCDAVFSHIDDLKGRSIFYQDLKSLFNQYLTHPSDGMFSELKTNDNIQDFEYQKKAFLKYFV